MLYVDVDDDMDNDKAINFLVQSEVWRKFC